MTVDSLNLWRAISNNKKKSNITHRFGEKLAALSQLIHFGPHPSHWLMHYRSMAMEITTTQTISHNQKCSRSNWNSTLFLLDDDSNVSRARCGFLRFGLKQTFFFSRLANSPPLNFKLSLSLNSIWYLWIFKLDSLFIRLISGHEGKAKITAFIFFWGVLKSLIECSFHRKFSFLFTVRPNNQRK